MEISSVADKRHQLGSAGERHAEEFLLKRGYVTLYRNFRTRYGEIDLVMKDGEDMVFIEVRTKSGTRFGTPAETVGNRKIARITRMAKMFFAMRNLPADIPCRFDVIGIVMNPDGKIDIEHIRNAFQT